MQAALLRTIREENGLTTGLFGQLLSPHATHEQVSRWEYEQDDIPVSVAHQARAIEAKFQQMVNARCHALRLLGARAVLWRYRTQGDFRADQRPAAEAASALLAVHGAVVHRVYRCLAGDGLCVPVIYLAVQDYWRWCARGRYSRTDETRDLWASEQRIL